MSLLAAAGLILDPELPLFDRFAIVISPFSLGKLIVQLIYESMSSKWSAREVAGRKRRGVLC
jgi:hypothetical protein